ncbi:MAG: hypothetical protein FJ308_23385, partial [Planctomycetes bacterium]|nr:hypothetical protein [Planctomycetota bacterium]
MASSTPTASSNIEERPQSPSKNPNGRLVKAMGWSILGCVVVLLTLLAFLPSIVGSRWFYQQLVDKLAVEGFRLEIGSADISWIRPIALRDIQLEQLEGPSSKERDSLASQTVQQASQQNEKGKLSLLSVQAIESNRSLLGYLIGGRNLGKITIIRLKVDIELLENSSNLEKLVRSIENSQTATSEPKSKKPPRIDLEIAITDASVAVVSQKREEELLVIPPFSIDVQYKSLDGNSRLLIAPSRILNQVDISQELVRLGLGRVIPLLAKSAWFDGKVSLDIDAIEVPLDHAERTQGRAQLSLHQVRSGPSEPVVINILEMIAKFRNKEVVNELVFVDESLIEITLGDEQVLHKGVQVGLPKLDPRLQITSSGSVGLMDNSLNLQLGIPVPVEIFAKRESVKQVGIPQLILPVRGTLDSPAVDWTAMRYDSADLLTVISAALGNEAPGTAAAMDALSGLAGGDADQAIGAAVDVLKE